MSFLFILLNEKIIYQVCSTWVGVDCNRRIFFLQLVHSVYYCWCYSHSKILITLTWGHIFRSKWMEECSDFSSFYRTSFFIVWCRKFSNKTGSLIFRILWWVWFLAAFSRRKIKTCEAFLKKNRSFGYTPTLYEIYIHRCPHVKMVTIGFQHICPWNL